MLWNIIRDFFVQYIFGGTTSEGYLFDGTIGTLFSIGESNYGVDNGVYGTSGTVVNIGNIFGEDVMFEQLFGGIYFGDWLSTTATIITLVALFVGISCLMVSLFRWIVRLVSLRG